MVLQALEGLSDRDDARALRDRISWKVACGLALDDEGFAFSVLAYWRTRLRESERPERIFDAVRSIIDATGVLNGKTRRALDSTLLDDAVAAQDAVTQLIAAIRRVRRVVPGARMCYLCSAHDYESAGKPLIAWDDPVAKAALVDALVNDALASVGRLRERERTSPRPPRLSGCWPWWPAKTSSKPTTARGRSPSVWPLTGSSRRSTPKPATCTSPARVPRRLQGPHRHRARDRDRDRRRAHPGQRARWRHRSRAAGARRSRTPGARRRCLWIRRDALVALGKADHQRAIKPRPLPTAMPGGFDRDDFVVDVHAGTATCPAAHTRDDHTRRAAPRSGSVRRGGGGPPVFLDVAPARA